MIVVQKRNRTKPLTVKQIPTGQPFTLGPGAVSVHIKVNPKDNKVGCNAVCLQNGCLEFLGDSEHAFLVKAKVVVE